MDPFEQKGWSGLFQSKKMKFISFIYTFVTNSTVCEVMNNQRKMGISSVNSKLDRNWIIRCWLCGVEMGGAVW